ncbi:hypothetical protein BDZ91DRAFT_709743 [Kalaharituber pfeilii]|nr:hypothetical protein BDZ91DRAFT_709743 [Kalaharituber pfeilii]
MSSLAPLGSTSVPITSLRDRQHFPTASTIPHEDDVDEDFYALAPGVNSYRPTKHWAYLGEITSMSTFLRLRLETRDAEGHTLPVAFHLEAGEGGFGFNLRMCNPVTPSDLNPERAEEDGAIFRKGYTLVLLYPELHSFMDGTTGFRVEEKESFNVIPYSLDELLTANDTIIEQKLPDFKPVCDNCAKPLEKEKRCAKCRVSIYCDKRCQAAHWKSAKSGAGGHRQKCDIFREVKWFTDKDWDNYTFRKGLRFIR